MDSDSFLGVVGPLDEISGKMKVVGEIRSSTRGPYRILIGERMGKKFILKTLKNEFRNDPVFTLMLRKEFEIGFSLSHPGTVRTIALEEVSGEGVCIIEEYVVGSSLDELLSRDSLKPEDVGKIVDGLLDAVAYLHSLQIIHNDLKPSNIIISDFDGMPRIIDFGYADSPAYTSLKFQGGTSRYIAPERLEQSGKSSPGSDIWSLGVIIDRLAPFAGKNKGKLRKLVSKCVVPVDRRLHSVAEMKALLHPKEGHGSVLGLGIALILVAAITLVMLFWNGDTGGSEGDEFQEKDKTEVSDMKEEVAEGAEGPVGVSLDGEVEKSMKRDKAADDKLVIETPPKDAPKEDAPKEDAPPKNDAPKEEVPKDGAQKEGATSLEYDRERCLELARQYAVKIAERSLDEYDEEEGSASQPIDRMMAGQTLYHKIMKEIATYVSTLDIPTDADREQITREAQSAAVALIRRRR